jgi:hypothetical protein
MIYFLTPLAAKKSVSDWDLTCELLKQTLGSLQNQTDGEFRSIVCCHNVPDFAKELDNRFLFVNHPFPAPDKALSISGTNCGARDMVLKRDVALYYAQPGPDDFVMLLDADDLLHCKLTQEIKALSKSIEAVTIDHGYEMCYYSKRLLRRTNMVDKSTSTWCLKGRYMKTPKLLLENELNSSIYHTVWHSNFYQFLADKKIPYQKLQEPRMIYLVNTSLNISDTFRKSVLMKCKQKMKFSIGRLPSELIRSEYNIKY